MTRSLFRAAGCVAVTALALSVSVGSAEDKAPSIHDIMKGCFNKKVGAFPKIEPLAKEGKWDDAKKHATELKKLANFLPKTKPEKGSEESWQKLAKEFAVKADAVYDNVEKKDAAATGKAVKGVGGTCKACHDAHRE